jgi:signal recognition particle subunit SRP72
LVLKALPRDSGDGAAAATLVEAALFMREREPDKAEALLAALVQDTIAGAEEVREAQLMRAQIAASAGEYVKAIAALAAIPEIAATPARVATLVALHELAGNAEGADAVLDEMMAAGSAGGAPPEVLLRVAERKLQQGRAVEAAAIYADIVGSRSAVAGGPDEDDRNAALAGVVAAKCADGDMLGAESVANTLFVALVTALGTGAAPDADDLEQTLPASVVARAAEVARKLGRKRSEARGGAGGDANDAKPKKRRRKKNTILPKGFDAANPGPPPDPERWLPLRERSTYRGKRKKVNVRGAQGAANMSTDLKGKEFSGGAGGVGGGGATDKGKAPEGMGAAMEKLMAGKQGKKKGGKR